MHYRTIIEPFRIKSVEPIGISTEEERGEQLKTAHCNPFLLRSRDEIIDLKAIVRRALVDEHDHVLVLRESERGSIPSDNPLFARTLFTPCQPTCEDPLPDVVVRIRTGLPYGATLAHVHLHGTVTSWAEWKE